MGIQEIIEAVNKLQKSHNQDKVDQIAQVLSMMDADADGVIKVDHVLKVIELLGNQNTELPAKQIKQIINVLCEEEKLLLEDSIEDILIKKTPKQENLRWTKPFKRNLKHWRKLQALIGQLPVPLTHLLNPSPPNHNLSPLNIEVEMEKITEELLWR